MSEERVHHPYSPSTLQNLEACPSYEGRQTEHPRALAGTLAHKVTETMVDDSALSDDDAEAAAECIDFYNQRKQLMEEAARHAGAYLSIFPIELSEMYLPIDDERYTDIINGIISIFDSTTAGYFDRAIIDHTGTYAEAFDWKFGVWKITECENNLQAISYVLGLFRKFPKLKTIQFFFKQPALDYLSSHIFARSDIPSLYLRVKVVTARARKARFDGNFESARPSVPVCMFCKHIAVCPKVTNFACKVGAKFAPLQIPESITPSMIQDPVNTGLGMQLAQVLKVWSDAFRSVTADRVLRGAPLPAGYQLISRDGSRKVTDPFAFKVRALEAGLTDEEFNDTRKISLGAVEQAIADKTPRGSKKEAVQNFKSCVESDNSVEKGSGCCYLQAVNDSKE